MNKLIADFKVGPPQDDERRAFLRLAAIGQYAQHRMLSLFHRAWVGVWHPEECWRRAELRWKAKPKGC